MTATGRRYESPLKIAYERMGSQARSVQQGPENLALKAAWAERLQKHGIR
ncbi:MAG: hypothetical protein ACQEXV_22520 [Bacillota bacterium]